MFRERGDVIYVHWNTVLCSAVFYRCVIQMVSAKDGKLKHMLYVQICIYFYYSKYLRMSGFTGLFIPTYIEAHQLFAVVSQI